jgi:hypothetical protein
MTVSTAFTPSDKAPFRFTASIGGQTFFITIPYNRYANRYYVQISDTNNTIVIYTPLVASPDNYDINLALPYAPGALVYRESTKNFEAT